MILLGAFIHGLLWLLVIGAVLFVATGIAGLIKRETLNRSRRPPQHVRRARPQPVGGTATVHRFVPAHRSGQESNGIPPVPGPPAAPAGCAASGRRR